MPWCTDCDRFYNPNSLNADGTCPTCGRQVADATSASVAESGARPEKFRRFSDEPTPWHFKVLVAAVSVYLSFRLYQGVVWVAQHV